MKIFYEQISLNTAYDSLLLAVNKHTGTLRIPESHGVFTVTCTHAHSSFFFLTQIYLITESFF